MTAPFDLAGPPLHIHLVGIGGAGMSAIAEVLAALGHRVSGSDRAEGPVLRRLRAAGIDARSPHDGANVDGADVVGVSTAIPADNPEIEAARASGIPVHHRFDLLAAIGATRRTLSVSGTHGKTTTSAMCAFALDRAGLDPSFIIGGEVPGLGAGARWRTPAAPQASADGWFVLEADESDSTFLAPPRSAAIVTNVEADHLDHHGTMDALVAAFRTFLAETAGPRVVCADDPGAAALAGEVDGVATYGLSDDATFHIVDVEPTGSGSAWTVVGPHGSTALRIGVPGLHVVRNATAAFAVAVLIGADPQGAARGLADYGGVGRRFEFRGSDRGVTFIDDYAHLPTEVEAVLAAAAAGRVDGRWSRVVAVFQPHRYSRTEAVWRDYTDSFVAADVAVVTEIYAAGEAARDGVSGRLIADAVAASTKAPSVEWAATREELLSTLDRVLSPGDLCLTMGAGDLTTLPDAMLARWSSE